MLAPQTVDIACSSSLECCGAHTGSEAVQSDVVAVQMLSMILGKGWRESTIFLWTRLD
jgi:hypothetical protein